MERNAVLSLQSARVIGADTVVGATKAAGAYLNLSEGISTAGAAAAQNTQQIAASASDASGSLLTTAADAGVLTDAVGSAGERLAATGTQAAGLGSKLATLGRGLFTLAGGWTTIAAVGIGAIAFGLFKLFTQETDVERANNRLADSFARLDEGLARSTGLAKDYAAALSSIKSDRVAIQVAQANVALAQQALATTSAAHGSAEYQSLVAQLASSLDALRIAESSLSGDQARAATARTARTAQDVKNEQERCNAIARSIELARLSTGAQAGSTAEVKFRDEMVARGELTDHAARIMFRGAAAASAFANSLEKDADKLAKGNPPLRTQVLALAEFSRILGHLPSDQQISVVLDAHNAREALGSIVSELERVRPKVNQFVDSLNLEARSIGVSNPQLAKRLTLLADFADKVGRLPTKKETEIALKTPSFRAAVEALSSVLAQMETRAGQKGFASGKAFADGFAQGENAGGLFSGISQLLAGAAKIGADVGKAAGDSSKAARDASKATLDAADKTLAANSLKVADARAATTTAAQTLADANRSLADAIRNGAQQIRDAVASADQNLGSIGQSLSDTISQFIDAQDKAGQLGNVSPTKIAEFKRLKEQILAGGGDADTIRKAQALASQIEGAQAKGGDPEQRKAQIKRNIADLVDEFNKGAISLTTFNRDVAALLAKEGISYKAAGKTLGIAFADGFRAQVEGLAKQAAAISAGPRIRGVTGLEPSIVKPIEAVRQSQRDIADAQQRRDDSLLAETKAEKALQRLEESHTRLMLAEARATSRHTQLMEQHLRFILAEEKKQTAALKGQVPRRPTPEAPRPARGPRGADSRRAREAAAAGLSP